MSTRRKPTRWQPDWAVLPGETITEALADRGLTQLAAAAAMGVAQSTFNEVIRGRHAITALWAIRLERLTGITADLWMGLQTRYDLAIERARLSDTAPEPRSVRDFRALIETVESGEEPHGQ